MVLPVAVLVAALLAISSTDAAASGDGPRLLHAGKSAPTGWSVLVFKAEFGSGGRIRVSNSEACEILFDSACHFAVPDGVTSTLLLDVPFDYGDTTASIATSGERVYVFTSSLNGTRSMARSVGGIFGALATQPDTSGPSAEPPTAGPLTMTHFGSAFDLVFVSASEPGHSIRFSAPPKPGPRQFER